MKDVEGNELVPGELYRIDCSPPDGHLPWCDELLYHDDDEIEQYVKEFESHGYTVTITKEY
jgi:hypothetical protein